MSITYRRHNQPKGVDHVSEHPNAPIVDLKKTRKKPSEKRARSQPTISQEKQADKLEMEVVVDKMIERGEIVPRDAPGSTTDPALREQFGKLLYVGASREVICDILKIPSDTYRKLKRQHLESVVESLAETGVMGMVALSFDKIEMASARTLQLISGMGDTPADRQDLMGAIRLLKDLESEKIGLLVKTGAIKVKKKVEISGHMELLNTGTQPMLTGEKAQGTMVKLMSELIAASEDEDEDDPESSES